jgi:signal transduction histidine kinase
MKWQSYYPHCNLKKVVHTNPVKSGKKDNFAKVVVSDTGLGIPVEYQRFLFQKFKQANSEFLSRDASQGTGLGLYISRMLVENMGGKIQLDSSVEAKGSEFSFTIPLAKN